MDIIMVLDILIHHQGNSGSLSVKPKSIVIRNFGLKMYDGQWMNFLEVIPRDIIVMIDFSDMTPVINMEDFEGVLNVDWRLYNDAMTLLGMNVV